MHLTNTRALRARAERMYPTTTRIRFRMKGVKGARVYKHGSFSTTHYSAGNASTR
jgi:hypothetical protein